MKEDISVQLLAQTSDSIHKLFDLSTRIDERVKGLQQKQIDVDGRVAGLVVTNHEVYQRLAHIEARMSTINHEEIGHVQKTTSELDRRLLTLEQTSKGSENRWNTVVQFIIQLVWVTMAAYILYKLNLNPPPVP